MTPSAPRSTRRLARHDILFEPLEVRGKVFRNRFYSVPHASFHPGRRLSDIAFRRVKAEGGWAAVCGGVVSIRPDSWGGFVPRIWDDEDRGFLTRLVTEVHGQGALAGIELGHGGIRGEGSKFEPSLGPSQVRDLARGRWVPKEMDLDDIRRLQDEWVAAAILAADLGYDIVYAYGAHGMLPAQFLSPTFNRRTDAYGGSLENRGRFWLEIIERFRAEIGDRCIVAVRIAAENFTSARGFGRRHARLHPPGRRSRRPVGRQRRAPVGDATRPHGAWRPRGTRWSGPVACGRSRPSRSSVWLG